jgi:hypothetical protein
MLRLAGQFDWLNQQVWRTFIADAEAVEHRPRRGVESWSAPYVPVRGRV